MTAVVVEPPVSLSPRHPQAIWGSEHLQFDLTAEQCLSPSSILVSSVPALAQLVKMHTIANIYLRVYTVIWHLVKLFSLDSVSMYL